MKRICSIGLGLLMAVVLFAPSAAHAQTKVKKKKGYDKVSSVDATAKTVAVTLAADGTTKDFKLDNFTTIVVNGKSAKLTEVVADMKVDLIIKSDGTTLSRIEAVDPPVEKTK